MMTKSKLILQIKSNKNLLRRNKKINKKLHCLLSLKNKKFKSQETKMKLLNIDKPSSKFKLRKKRKRRSKNMSKLTKRFKLKRKRRKKLQNTLQFINQFRMKKRKRKR